MTTTAQPRRRWLLYGLRALVALLLLACIVRGWIAVKLEPVKQERAAADAITQLDGAVSWEYPDFQNESRGQAWLRKLLGDDYFARPESIVVRSDAAIPYLTRFKQLPHLVLDGPQVTDVGLEHLEGLSQLEELFITGTQVTDAGFVHLKGLTQLRKLSLWDTPVTDAGLEHLTQLTQLQELSFVSNQVTDAGLKHLSKLTQLRRLSIAGTQATGAGLEQLKALTRLEQLNLTDVPVSDRDVRKLKRAMPNCSIMSTGQEDGHPRQTVVYERGDKDETAIRLLLADTVQKDLDLTADQMQKIAELAQFSKEQTRQLAVTWSEMSSDGSEQMSAERSEELSAQTQAMAAKQKKLWATVVEMLTPSQRERLRQIQLQYAMPVALLQPSFIKALGISDEQLDRIRQQAKVYVGVAPKLMKGLDIPDEEHDKIYLPSNLAADRNEALLHAFDGLSPSGMLKKMVETAKENAATVAEAKQRTLDVLSAEQRATLETLVGKPIEPTWDFDALMPGSAR